MYLGDSLEEKKETYELLTKKARKWGKIFAILGGITGLGMSGIFSQGEGGGLIIGLISLIGSVIGYYFYGQILFYGYINVSKWFVERGIGGREVANAAGTSFLVSFILGGRKAAKINLIMMLCILLAVVTVGVFVGLFNFIKVKREVISEGIAKGISAII